MNEFLKSIFTLPNTQNGIEVERHFIAHAPTPAPTKVNNGVFHIMNQAELEVERLSWQKKRQEMMEKIEQILEEAKNRRRNRESFFSNDDWDW